MRNFTKIIKQICYGLSFLVSIVGLIYGFMSMIEYFNLVSLFEQIFSWVIVITVILYFSYYIGNIFYI